MEEQVRKEGPKFFRECASCGAAALFHVNASLADMEGGDVTRGGGLRHERVVFLGPGGKTRAEVHLKRGHVRKLEQFGFASRVADA